MGFQASVQAAFGKGKVHPTPNTADGQDPPIAEPSTSSGTPAAATDQSAGFQPFDVEESQPLPPPYSQVPHSFRKQLDAHDPNWRGRTAVRMLAVVANITALACIGVILTSPVNALGGHSLPYFGDIRSLRSGIFLYVFSLLWTVVNLLVHFLRRPPRPIRPSGCSNCAEFIVLFGMFLAMAMAVFAMNERMDFDLETMSDSGVGYLGHYVQAPNGTWVYEITYVADDYYSYASRYPRTAEASGDVESNGYASAFQTRGVPAEATTVAAVVVRTSAGPAAAKRTPESETTPTTPESSSSQTADSSSSTATETSSTGSASRTRGSPSTTRKTAPPVSAVTRKCREYLDCAAQDALFNEMHREGPTRDALCQTVTAMTAVVMLGHLLFTLWGIMSSCCHCFDRAIARAATEEGLLNDASNATQ